MHNRRNAFTSQAKPTGFLDKATCASAVDAGYGACIVKMFKSDMLASTCGYWCPTHQHRGKLLNWAAENNYPAITFRGKMRYAIGVAGYAENKMFWETAVLMGNEDMMNAAIAHVEELVARS